jgi:phosphonate transport system substrate-binding protein
MRFALAFATAGFAIASMLPIAALADTYKLAITDVEGLERLQTEWGPFKAAMEAATGHSFEFYPVNSRTAAAEALRAKRVDFVVTGPAEYVVINKMTEARPLIGLSRPDYFCAIVVMADSPVVKPADLKGQKIALDDIGSTSGHLCPSQVLADYGVNPTADLADIVHTSRNVAHEALKRGDIAAIGVNYTSWINNTRAKDTSIAPGAFRVIARSGDLPNDILMVAAHVDAAAADAIRDALIGQKQSVIDGILAGGDENSKFRGMDLVAVTDAAYDPIRAMYVTIGQPQFSNFVGE